MERPHRLPHGLPRAPVVAGARLDGGMASMQLSRVAYPLSQPTPSPSRSNPCGSDPTTVNRRYEMSPQSRSGGGGGMQTVGYDGSQFPPPDPDDPGGGGGGGVLVGAHSPSRLFLASRWASRNVLWHDTSGGYVATEAKPLRTSS